MRQPNFIQVDGRATDTASREWLLICLARHICRMQTKDMRNGFIEKLIKKGWSPADVEELQRVTRIEWQRMYPNIQKKMEAAAHDNA